MFALGTISVITELTFVKFQLKSFEHVRQFIARDFSSVRKSTIVIIVIIVAVDCTTGGHQISGFCFRQTAAQGEILHLCN